VQILTADEIRAWDAYTIANEPIASIDLMERAAAQCVHWLENRPWITKKFLLFCGKGNNGGDGLSIGRQLISKGYSVTIYLLEFGKPGSEDFQTNLRRLHEMNFSGIHFIQNEDLFPPINKQDIVIDCLFGSGLNKPLDGLSAVLAQHISASQATVVSIDIPSGLFLDQSSRANQVIKATYTLSFQCYKLALLLQENAPYLGEVHILAIGLHPGYLSGKAFHRQLVDKELIKEIYKLRNPFAHKGSFGHSLIISGSYGKMGAAVIAAKACVRSGAGLTSIYIPKCGYEIIQVAVPEVMVITDASADNLSSLPADIEKYSSIGVGPGIGTKEETIRTVSFIVRRYKKPLVIDADGLNCISLDPDLLTQLPPFTIITPHPKEFDRLFGDHPSDFDRMNTAIQKAAELNIIIVLKGHHTLIANPGGQVYFNSTGNAGMAKGGSGDALTGILTGLLGQGYSPANAAIFGVYLHGLAGDLAAENFSQEAMTSSDLVESLGNAFISLAAS
jgi:ADP-dependent NAD(P)H-hydrate dehydratase / NAD(P)H-hydrate epimerase